MKNRQSDRKQIVTKMTTVTIELTSTGDLLHIGLVTNVQNMAELRQRVIGGQLDCVLVKPSLVPR